MTSKGAIEPLHCPKCDATMQAVPADFGHHVHRCDSCHGLFCSAQALDAMQRAWFERPQREPEQEIDTGHPETGRHFDERTEITCPSCGTWMDAVSADDQPDVWFEHCANCRGAFFDAGELTDLRYKTLADTVREFVGPRRSK